jgi:hypothetical protein
VAELIDGVIPGERERSSRGKGTPRLSTRNIREIAEELDGELAIRYLGSLALASRIESGILDRE